MKRKKRVGPLTPADFPACRRVDARITVDVELHCWLRNYVADENRRRRKAGMPANVTVGSLYDAAVRMLQAEIVRRRALAVDRAAPPVTRGFRSGGSTPR